MKNSKAIILGVVIGGAVLFLLYFFYKIGKGIGGGNKYQWYTSIRSDSDQPYGTLFIKKMLQSYRRDGKFVVNEKEPLHKLLEKNDYESGDTDYVLIGQSIHLDDADLTAMIDFVRQGNDVFIATFEAPTKLIESIYIGSCRQNMDYEYFEDSILHTNFYHKEFKRSSDYEYRYRHGNRDYPFAWRSLDPEAVCDTLVGFTPLGYQQTDRVNFLRIREGKGNVYLHTVPLLFTNYYMTKKDKMEYASSVFSHLSGTNMIWDDVSTIPFSDLQDPYNSPLYYMMQQPALKYAWWMLIIGAILYVLFASKRTQRVIPVLEPKSNTSLEFLNVISSLHYQNANHLDMARKKMKYFLYFIRARYGINTQSFTEEQAKRLAEKSKVDLADVLQIRERYKVIENYSMSDDEPADRLVGLYQAIDKFYKNCK